MIFVFEVKAQMWKYLVKYWKESFNKITLIVKMIYHTLHRLVHK